MLGKFPSSPAHQAPPSICRCAVPLLHLQHSLLFGIQRVRGIDPWTWPMRKHIWIPEWYRRHVACSPPKRKTREQPRHVSFDLSHLPATNYAIFWNLFVPPFLPLPFELFNRPSGWWPPLRLLLFRKATIYHRKISKLSIWNNPRLQVIPNRVDRSKCQSPWADVSPFQPLNILVEATFRKIVLPRF